MTTPDYRSTITTYLAPHRLRLVGLLVALLSSIGLQLVIPLLLQRFIDSALGGVAVSSLVVVGVAYLGAGIGNQILSAIATYIGADLGWRATNQIRHDLAGHLIDLDMGFHTDTTPGEMIERIDGDVTAVANFLARFVVRIAGSAITLVGVLIVTLIEDWRLGAAIGVYILIVLAVLMRLRSYAVSAAEEERETSAMLYGFIEERIAGIEDIRANGAGPYTMYRFVDVMRDFYERTVRAWRKRTVFWVSANTAFWSGDALALAAGVWLQQRGEITVGTAYLILQYVQVVRNPIEQVAQEFQELQKAAGGIIRIDQLRAVSSKLRSGSETTVTSEASIQFDHVTFSYDEKTVLDDVDFSLGSGRVLGLLGRTGGGKTTLSRLITRLYDPDQGRVLVGGTDVRQLDLATLRGVVGMVSQEVHLFAATVRENLTFFDPSVSDERLLETLHEAGLGKWILGIGLDTELESGGKGLSAGEAQLLAFARVFIQDPPIVILDEPSSRLDPYTESLITEATHRLFRGRTVVLVAHRLASVQMAHEIMVMEDGRIAEHGDRTTLAGDPTSRYSHLLSVGSGSELS